MNRAIQHGSLADLLNDSAIDMMAQLNITANSFARRIIDDIQMAKIDESGMYNTSWSMVGYIVIAGEEIAYVHSLITRATLIFQKCRREGHDWEIVGKI